MLIYNGILYNSRKELEEYADSFAGRNADIHWAHNSMALFIFSDPSGSSNTAHGPFKLVETRNTVPPQPLPHKVASQTTELLFPSDMTPEEQRINQLNYDSFICVMAEMMQKYAPKVLSNQEAGL